MSEPKCGCRIGLEDAAKIRCPDCGKDWGHSYCGSCGGRGTVRELEQIIIQCPLCKAAPAMLDIVEELAGSATSFTDPRIKYAEIQVSPDLVMRANALLAAAKGRTP